MLIDTHAHLNFNAFKEDFDKVIEECLENNTWVINVGTQYNTSQRAVEIAQNYKQGVYAAVGLHPVHLETGLVKIKIDSDEVELKTREEEFDYERYKELAKSSKVIAIGEVGLDYWYRPKGKKKREEFKEKQKEVFLRQVELAKEMSLPVIVHCRLALDEILQILDSDNRGVIHCYTGNKEQAQEFLEKGFYLGFNGIIFKLDLEEVIKNTPLDRMLIETDSPYLSPPPFQNERNSPLYLKYIIERIAKIKGINSKAVEEATTQNARNLFGI